MSLYPGIADPIPTPEAAPVRAAWRTCATTRDRHLYAFRALLGRSFEYPGGSGAGIVTVGGGKYWPGIVVGCRLLRELGCTLPVQVWYRGDAEPVRPEQVAGLGVELVDATTVGDPRVLRGWEAKLHALVHCPFDDVLFLDADAYLVNDPTPLIETARAKRFAFWVDLPGTEKNVKWDRVWPEGSRGIPAVQGGQLAIHRPSFWRELVLAHWLNQHSDFYYAHMFGDQDTWRVVLAATGGPYADLGRASWRHTSFVCEHAGAPRVVHRCQGKLFRPTDIEPKKTGYSSPQPSLPREGRVFDLLAETLRDEADARLFDTHYRRGLWGGGSGTGSVPAEAKPFVDVFNAVASFAGWQSVTDAGCGDGRVAAALRVPEYRGYDVSPAALDLFATNAPGRQAERLDIYRDRDRLPAADVLIGRDVLHHWPNEWVADWLSWVRASRRWPSVLLCQDVHQWHDGQDCHLGGYRALHPHLAPLKQFAPRVVVEYLHKAVLLLDCRS